MSKEQLRKSLNAELIGEVTEKELMELSGAYDVTPNTTPLTTVTTSSAACTVAITLAFCPTIKCTSKC